MPHGCRLEGSVGVMHLRHKGFLPHALTCKKKKGLSRIVQQHFVNYVVKGLKKRFVISITVVKNTTQYTLKYA